MDDPFVCWFAMTQSGVATAGPERLLPKIEGEDCNYCDTGELARGEHKGRTAVLCTDCGTPQITLS